VSTRLEGEEHEEKRDAVNVMAKKKKFVYFENIFLPAFKRKRFIKFSFLTFSDAVASSFLPLTSQCHTHA
jgi:hypothetical protein